MALNSPPKKINTLIRKYTCVVNEHGGPRFYPHQYQNQGTLDELDEVLRTASAADVNYQDAWGEPILILAISSDKCVRRLVTVNGIDVNIVNEKGNTALIEASMAGNVSTVDLLLQNADIDINHRNKLGNTAFIFAARSSRNSVVCSLLKDPELDVNATNNVGMTALMSACAHALDMATVRLLLESKRIDVHWTNKDGQTALLVVSTNARKVVQAYLEATASPETLDPVDNARLPPLQTTALDESAPRDTEAATMAQTVSNSDSNVTVATHSGNESTLLPLSAVSQAIPAKADLRTSYAPSFPASPTSWLAVDLLNTGFDSHLVQLCEQKLVVELGLASERILALFAPG